MHQVAQRAVCDAVVGPGRYTEVQRLPCRDCETGDGAANGHAGDAPATQQRVLWPVLSIDLDLDTGRRRQHRPRQRGDVDRARIWSDPLYDRISENEPLGDLGLEVLQQRIRRRIDRAGRSKRPGYEAMTARARP